MAKTSSRLTRRLTKNRVSEALICLVLMCLALAIKVITIRWALSHNSIWLGHIYVDVWQWAQRFNEHFLKGEVPYVQFSFEYPVGTGLFYWLMSKFAVADDYWQNLRLHAYFMTVFEVINVGLFYFIAVMKKAKHPVFLTLLFFLIPTGIILNAVRFEAVVLTTVFVGYYFHLKRKPLWASFFWSVGSTLKWFPVFFIFAQEYADLKRDKKGRRKRGLKNSLKNFLSGLGKKQWLKSGLILALVTLAFNLPFIAADYFRSGNIEMWKFSYLFHMHRPIYWDTLLGIWIMWTGYHPLEQYGAYWTLALVLAASFVKPKMKFEYRCIIVIIAAIVCNRVYSPQYHLWFYPFLLFALDKEKGFRYGWLLGLYIVLDFTNMFVYPLSFAYALGEMGGFGAFSAQTKGGLWTKLFSAAIVFRTILLILLSVYVLNSRTQRQLENS